MSKVNLGESLDQYPVRCVPVVLKESGTKGRDYVVGKCAGMYKQAKKVSNAEPVPDGVQVLRNAFCPTGKGGGVDPTCSSRGKGGSTGVLFDRLERIKNKDSAAYGGVVPEGNRDLRVVYHQTSPENALKILQTGLIKPASSISKELASEGYGDTIDGGDYVYVGLNKQASSFAAVSDGVTFKINANPLKDKAVLQKETEGGIALIHGSVPLNKIGFYAVEVNNPSSKEGKAVLAAFAKYKKK